MWDKILIILFETGFGIKFNFIGTISISELFLIFASVFFVKRQLFRNYPSLKKISFLYLGLLCAQIISEIIVGNEPTNTFRGIAVTVVSYLHFVFLFRLIIKDQILVVFALVGLVAQQLIFGGDEEFNASYREVITGEGAKLVKFYLATIVINSLLVLSVFTKPKPMIIFLILTGGILIILGARSYGLITILTGMIAYAVIITKSINWNRLAVTAVFIILMGYGAYTVYVNKVLNGEITSGNSWQLTQMKNPYNPIMLLFNGRTEVFVGWEAFMDEFWFGHGTWAADKTGKYQILMSIMSESETYISPDDNIIPVHSVLIGAGMSNGIFAFLFMFAIVYFFIKKGILSIRKNDTYVIILISFIITLLWTALFSPTSHFRLSMPLFFATFFASYIINTTKRKYENMFYHYR